MNLSKQQETARQIKAQGGFITDIQAAIIAPAHPNMQVLVRWQDGRETVTLSNLNSAINNQESKGRSLRDVCLLANLSESFYRFYGIPLDKYVF